MITNQRETHQRPCKLTPAHEDGELETASHANFPNINSEQQIYGLCECAYKGKIIKLWDFLENQLNTHCPLSLFPLGFSS